MEISILKFGGLSLATPIEQKKVISIILENKGKTVVVCSAMGRIGFPYSTGNLELLAPNNYISLKERDRLLGCGEIISSVRLSYLLNEKERKTYALSYLENGIECDDSYSKGKVENLNSSYLFSYFENYDVLIIPGFIASNKTKELTTLGRGNSDYSAVLVTLMCNAKEVKLYKDIDGIYFAPPRLFQQNQLYDYLSYDEMELLINIGFGVISLDALKAAKQNEIIIKIYNYKTNVLGTVISSVSKGHLFLGVNIIEKIVKIASFKPQKVRDILVKSFKENHIFIKGENIQNNQYSFEISKSVTNLVKRIIYNEMNNWNNND